MRGGGWARTSPGSASARVRSSRLPWIARTPRSTCLGCLYIRMVRPRRSSSRRAPRPLGTSGKGRARPRDGFPAEVEAFYGVGGGGGGERWHPLGYQLGWRPGIWPSRARDVKESLPEGFGATLARLPCRARRLACFVVCDWPSQGWSSRVIRPAMHPIYTLIEPEGIFFWRGGGGGGAARGAKFWMLPLLFLCCRVLQWIAALRGAGLRRERRRSG